MAKAVTGDGNVEGMRHDRLPEDNAILAQNNRDVSVVLGHGGHEAGADIDRIDHTILGGLNGSIGLDERWGDAHSERLHQQWAAILTEPSSHGLAPNCRNAVQLIRRRGL